MVEIIIVSHGNYAGAMLESSELIMGKQENVTAFGFVLGENVEDLKDSIDKKIESIHQGAPSSDILVFTDMKSGSPFNAAARLMEKHSFHHFAGVNLPILLEVLGTRNVSTVDELCEMIVSEGKETIVDVNKLMGVE